MKVMKKNRNMIGLVAPLFVLGVFASVSSACHIGDFVWNDANCNGIQDAGEMGVLGVVVNLYDCDSGLLILSTTTDLNGHYLFGVTPGNYRVGFILPPNYVFSLQDQGGDDALDSDADPVTGLTTCTTIEADEYDSTWDAGLCVIEPPGTGTPGYWKNHPEAWPVEQITIGGVTYAWDAAIAIMKEPKTKQDKTYTMFAALVAAKLNILIGNAAGCITDTIADADSWMGTYGPVGSGKKGNSNAWVEGEPLYNMLDAYNNGELCAPARE